jgi:hypothetical protein
MVSEFSERRRNERVPLKLPVSGKCIGTTGDIHHFQGETRDVSFAGFCVKLDSINEYIVGQKVDFETRLYQGNFQIKGRGRVCWVHDLSDPHCPSSMGVMLTSLPRYSTLWHERVKDRIHQLHKITEST